MYMISVWPFKLGLVFLVPCKVYLVECTLLYTWGGGNGQYLLNGRFSRLPLPKSCSSISSVASTMPAIIYFPEKKKKILGTVKTEEYFRILEIRAMPCHLIYFFRSISLTNKKQKKCLELSDLIRREKWKFKCTKIEC